MDFKTSKPNHIEDILTGLHEGQWFSWKDSKDKIYANLVVNEGYKKPTKLSLEKSLAARQEAVPWEQVRAQRNRQLRDSDWTDLPSSPLSENKKQDWQEYRQSLRDVPQQDTLPDAVVWPEAPEV